MKPATIRDVAERAGVSVASVSRVLNGAGPVAETTRHRVLDAVKALHYVPHSGARSLSMRKTDAIGVILPDLYGEYFSELIRGLDLAARASGYHLIVSSSHDDAEEASTAIRAMRGRVDGLIVLSPHLDAANLASSLAGELPVLLMNGGATDADRPSIVIDNHGGAVTAVEHLVAQGRRSIAHVAGPTGNIEAESRLAGYLEAMARAGLAPRVIEGDFTQESGRLAVADLLAGGPLDAVFAANDNMAVGVLVALADHGRAAPEDVAVVGFDDIPLASLVRPALTTLSIDIAASGRRALERVVSLIESRGGASADPACEIVRPRLVVRASSVASETIVGRDRSLAATSSFKGERS